MHWKPSSIADILYVCTYYKTSMIAYNKPCISPQIYRQCCTQELETILNFLGEAGDKIKQNTWFSFNPIPNFDPNCLQLRGFSIGKRKNCYIPHKGAENTGREVPSSALGLLRGSALAKPTLIRTKLKDGCSQREISSCKGIWPKTKA